MRAIGIGTLTAFLTVILVLDPMLFVVYVGSSILSAVAITLIIW